MHAHQNELCECDRRLPSSGFPLFLGEFAVSGLDRGDYSVIKESMDRGIGTSYHPVVILEEMRTA